MLGDRLLNYADTTDLYSPTQWLRDMQEMLRCLHCLSIGDWLVIQETDLKEMFMLPFPSYYCNNVTDNGLCLWMKYVLF